MAKNVLKYSTILLFAIFFYVVSVPASMGIPLSTRYVVILALCIVLFTSEHSFINKLIPDKFNVLWLLIIFDVFLSVILNKVSMGGLLNTALIYLLYFVIIANNLTSLVEVSIGLIIFGDYLIFECLQKQNLVYFWYQGIMNNPNQLGLTLVAPFIACLYLVVYYHNSQHSYFKILFIINAAFNLFIIWCTSARASLLSCMVSLLIILGYKFKENVVLSKKKIYLIASLLFVISFTILCNIDNVVTFLTDTFIDKYNSTDDISSQRFEMWKQVINESKLLGYGYTYLPCHNDFLIFVQKYGLIFSILFCFFIISVLLVLPKIKVNEDEKLFYGVYIISCLIISMFEEIISMFGKPIVVLMFIVIGIVIKNYRKEDRIE